LLRPAIRQRSAGLPFRFRPYDLTMRRVVEPGGFTVFVGGSSDGGLKGRFRVVGDTLVLASPPPRLQ
jgi:hypothetical protein